MKKGFIKFLKITKYYNKFQDILKLIEFDVFKSYIIINNKLIYYVFQAINILSEEKFQIQFLCIEKKKRNNNSQIYFKFNIQIKKAYSFNQKSLGMF